MADIPNGPRSPRFPEPKPIDIDPAILDRAKDVLNSLSSGSFDRSQLAPQLDAFVGPDVFDKGAALVSSFGPFQSMFPFEERIDADQKSTYFRVQYTKELLTWVVGVDVSDRITKLSLQRGPNHRIFCIVCRDVQY